MAKEKIIKKRLEDVWSNYVKRYTKDWTLNNRDLRCIKLFTKQELKNLDIGDTPLFKWLHKYKSKNRKLLDAGCGCGFFTIYSKKLGYSPIGIDLSKESIKLARKLARINKTKIKFLIGDVRNMPFKDNSFDIVLSSGVIEHFSDTGKAVKEHSRVLKSKGILIGNIPYRYSIFVPNKFFQKILGKWQAGYEKSFSISKIKNLFNKHNLNIEEVIRSPIRPGKRFPFYGKILNKIEKPFFSTGFGGMHLYFLARKI